MSSLHGVLNCLSFLHLSVQISVGINVTRKPSYRMETAQCRCKFWLIHAYSGDYCFFGFILVMQLRWPGVCARAISWSSVTKWPGISRQSQPSWWLPVQLVATPVLFFAFCRPSTPSYKFLCAWVIIAVCSIVFRITISVYASRSRAQLSQKIAI